MWVFLGGVLALLLVMAGVMLYRGWFAPARRLEHLMQEVAEGRQPAAFLVHGWPWFRRQSEYLDRIARRQQELQRRLYEDNFNLRAVLGCMVEGVMVVDDGLRIRLVNAEFRELFDTPSDPVGRTVLETVRASEIATLLRGVLLSGQARVHEIVLHRGAVAGDSRQVRVNVVPIREDDGEVTGAVVVFHDVSRLKQLEDVRREFVANVSHELRTPMAIFRGYLETLIDTPNLTAEDMRGALAKMERHCTRLTLLIDDLLTLTRLESGRINIQPVSLRPEPFLRRVVEDYRMRFAAESVEFTVRLPRNLPTIEADPLRLEQVLFNLFANAVAYSGEEKRIELSAGVEGESMLITVTDNGMGIPAAELPHIFKRFYRVDKGRSRAHGGTGLGLSIVKHIVQRHGGSVAAESEVGKWTRIKLFFPLKAREDAEEEAAGYVADSDVAAPEAEKITTPGAHL